MSYYKAKIVIKTYLHKQDGERIIWETETFGPVYFNENNINVVYKKMISSDEFKDSKSRIMLTEDADFKFEIKLSTKEKYDQYVLKMKKLKQ